MRIPPDDKNTVQYAGTQDDNIMITFQQRVEASSDSSMIHQMIASISRWHNRIPSFYICIIKKHHL